MGIQYTDKCLYVCIHLMWPTEILEPHQKMNAENCAFFMGQNWKGGGLPNA